MALFLLPFCVALLIDVGREQINPWGPCFFRSTWVAFEFSQLRKGALLETCRAEVLGKVH